MFATIVFFAIVILDQAVKYFTVHNIPPYERGSTLIPYVLGLYHTTNTGGGWSILQGNVLFLVVIPIFVCALIAYTLISKRVSHSLFKWSLVFVLGGAVGNLIDRVFNKMHVVDMFEFLFMDFPIFNVADVFITIGAVMIFVYFLFIEKENHNEKS